MGVWVVIFVLMSIFMLFRVTSEKTDASTKANMFFGWVVAVVGLGMVILAH